MVDAASLVSVQNVSMIYRTKDSSGQPLETIALQDANLEIEPGEFISLIGPSGCGKTTLLRLLADLIQPTSGELRIGGKTPTQARASRAYGYVFQAPALLEWRTVQQNVMLPLEIMGFQKDQRQSRTEQMLKLVGLEKFARNYPWQLSGGMQQRASIARALAFDPQLIFMDEPFGALDEITRENLNLELLRLWRETGKTIIFVTHSIPEAVFLSTRIVVMTPRPGKIEKIINVDLPQPRDFETRESPRFFEIATEVRESLRHGHGYEVE
jgi:NitT/TauT family transport system ATP-binding protein